MVTLSRILVWRIPQTEEPIGLTVLEVAVRQTEPAYIHASAEQKTFKSLLLTSVTVMPGGITIIPPGGEKAVSERLSHSPNATQLERVCDSKLPDYYSSPSLCISDGAMRGPCCPISGVTSLLKLDLCGYILWFSGQRTARLCFSTVCSHFLLLGGPACSGPLHTPPSLQVSAIALSSFCLI